MEFVLSTEDQDLLQAYSWNVGSHGYFMAYRRGAGRNGVRRHVLLHHLILQRISVRPGKHYVADHRNGNKLDNRRSNLRWLHPKQSTWNTGGHTKFGYKGVERTRAKQPRFAAYICESRTNKRHLGCFDTPEDAARAHDAAVRATRQGFGRLNFPLPEETTGATSQ